MAIKSDIFSRNDKTVRAKVLQHTVLNGVDVEPGDEVVVPLHVFRDLKYTKKLEAIDEEETEESLPTAKTVLGEDAVKIATAAIIKHAGKDFPPKEDAEAFATATAKASAMAADIIAALNASQKAAKPEQKDKTATRKELRGQ